MPLSTPRVRIKVSPVEESDGKLACAALCLFDIGLGGLTLFNPELYCRVFHPTLVDPQLDLIQRLGAVWLAFALIAGIAATRRGVNRAPWFLVVAVVRFLEVPADLIYGSVAHGASTLSRVLIYCAPPLNFVAGYYLFYVARELWRRELADTPPATPPISDLDPA
jgi:hypothetical protein